MFHDAIMIRSEVDVFSTWASTGGLSASDIISYSQYGSHVFEGRPSRFTPKTGGVDGWEHCSTGF